MFVRTESRNLLEMLQLREQLCRINDMELMPIEGPKLRYNFYIYRQTHIGMICVRTVEIFVTYAIQALARTESTCSALMVCSSF